MICTSPVNIQTDRQKFDQLISIAQPAELKTDAKPNNDRQLKRHSQANNNV